MNNKIRSRYRYNTVSKSQVKRNRENMNFNKRKYNSNHKNTMKITKINKSNIKKNNRNVKKYSRSSRKEEGFFKTISKVFACVCVLVLIMLISKKISKTSSNSIISVFNSKTTNTNFVPNYNLKVGLYKIDATDMLKTTNVLVNELEKYSNLSLIKINDDYSIKYVVASNIEKISNKEYKIYLDKKYGIDSSQIIENINQIKQAGNTNVYYSSTQNIANVSGIDDDTLDVTLNNEDEYFIYSLDFPIYSSSSFNNLNPYIYDNQKSNTASKNIVFSRNDKYSNNILSSINLTNYEDSGNMVADFRDDKLDMFLTSSYDDMQLIGKHDYGIKKYRNGEAIFIFGNKNSSLYKQKEVRQALSYLINREDIIKSNIMIYCETIDLPYIYSKTQYKYDVTGANNLLLSNSWKKINGIYTKNIDGTNQALNLKMLVNEDDNLKCGIADSIQQMALANGIDINVCKLSENKINEAINNNDYDIILATVNMNQNPSINYLNNFLDINDTVQNAMNSVKVSDIKNISANIQNLQNVLSEECACIGILARDTNVIYQKGIDGFETISYMNIFKNIESIGKEK